MEKLLIPDDTDPPAAKKSRLMPSGEDMESTHGELSTSNSIDQGKVIWAQRCTHSLCTIGPSNLVVYMYTVLLLSLLAVQ